MALATCHESGDRELSKVAAPPLQHSLFTQEPFILNAPQLEDSYQLDAINKAYDPAALTMGAHGCGRRHRKRVLGHHSI